MTNSHYIDAYKKSYENLEHFNELVDNELSELLSDSVKSKFLKNIQINDNLDIYKDLKKDDMVLEIEAYANQANIAQTLNAFEYFCLKYN